MPEPESMPIVVAGDSTIDWLMVPIEASAGEAGENFRQFAARHSSVMPGGALLLAEMTRQCLAPAGVKAGIAGPKTPAALWQVAPNDVIHSTSALRSCPPVARTGKDRVLRVSEHFGYHGPENGVPKPLPLDSNPARARVVVLDDAGNGFRSHPEAWPRTLDDESALVLLKMSRPLFEGALWQKLLACRDRLIVVLRADELRRLPGVRVSRSLSWERTAKELLFHMRRSAALEPLHRCAHVVVTFDTDGALWYRPGDGGAALLMYDPRSLEGSMATQVEGSMIGLTSMLTATLAAQLCGSGVAGLEHGVKDGLARQRAMLELGYAMNGGRLESRYADVFKHANAGAYCAVEIDPTAQLDQPDPHFFRILTAKTRFVRAQVAREIVLHGNSSALSEVPVGRFGKLVTIDRAEIEAYAAIRELLVEYLAHPKPPRPLCFAVFGPPGAGKSFGVKQVADSVGDKSLESITFNISQFRAYADLVSALHRVRDKSLEGKTPFVFFDEFDAAFDNQPLGWLQYFLAPMQDGEFLDGETAHPIGKAVLVFAGGTRSSYERFAMNIPDALGDAPAGEVVERAKGEFRAAKGPDFVSRLRGFINVMGPNRQPSVARNDNDDAFVIRRALVLRNMLERSAKTAGLIDGHKRMRIDEGVLRALLFVESYTHGMRSMEAVLDMSRIAGRWHFDGSCLPSREQLAMHVNADELFFLAEQERFRTLLAESELPASTDDDSMQGYRAREDALVEAVARAIHADYVACRAAEGQSSGAIEPWDRLTEAKRTSNRDAAAEVPSKLRAVHHGLRRVPEGQPARTPDLTDAEIEKLARMEHERWCREQRMQGFIYGPVRSERTHPYLVEYDQLPADVRKYDVEAVQAVPRILRDLGYEIFRLEEVDDLRDIELVELLARAVHDNYVEKRKAEGDTEQNNPSLRTYDQLSDTLKQSNRDVARSIARKLASIGFRVHRAAAGHTPTLLELPEDKLEQLAEQEHARWAWERRFDGWTYKAGKKNEQAKTTPHLAPWNELPDAIKQYDRDNVKLLPELLKRAEYEAVRDER